jgi:hypothetical protein
MTSMQKTVHDDVEAALLNSECSPEDAVRTALRAVAKFSKAELAFSQETFAQLACVAFQESDT